MPAITAAFALLLVHGATIGLQKGDAVAPFEPYHVSGPYEGTRQCPICEWGLLPLVMVWTDLGQSDPSLRSLVEAVSEEVKGAKTEMKGFLIDANLSNQDSNSEQALKSLASSWRVPDVYLLSRGSQLKECLKNYKLSAKGWRTVVYTVKDRHVTQTFVDPTSESLADIRQAIRAIE